MWTCTTSQEEEICLANDQPLDNRPFPMTFYKMYSYSPLSDLNKFKKCLKMWFCELWNVRKFFLPRCTEISGLQNWIEVTQRVPVAVEKWSSVGCGCREGRSSQQVTQDDSHLHVIRESLCFQLSRWRVVCVCACVYKINLWKLKVKDKE